MRTHLSMGIAGTECGRGKRSSRNVFDVDCQLCQNTDRYRVALVIAKERKEAAFQAQTPREVREPWREGVITCRECQGTQFRERDRTCYGHYANYQCSNCEHVESRLTETGMSF